MIATKYKMMRKKCFDRYNPAAMSAPVTLKNVNVAVPIEGGQVTNMQSRPTGNW